MTDPRARGRRNFLLIAAVFLLPLVAAFAMYYGGIWTPSGSSAKGELIHPAQPLVVKGLSRTHQAIGPELFAGKWSLIYIGDGRCDASCRTALTFARQTRLALGNEMDRVQRILLATAGPPDSEYFEREQPGLVVVEAVSPEAAGLLAQFPGDRSQSLYIVDPLGNLMMRHDATQVINKDLLTDLKKLLKLSHIG